MTATVIAPFPIVENAEVDRVGDEEAGMRLLAVASASWRGRNGLPDTMSARASPAPSDLLDGRQP